MGKRRRSVHIQINGATVYCEQHGTIGDPVLLLHGWGCDTTFFAPIIKTLAETMRVTVIDFPGHGKSSQPPEPWGVPDYGEMTRELMDTLHIHPCYVIAKDYNALDEQMRKTFVKIVSQDLQPLLPIVSVPTLLVWGDQDTETPLWMGQTMAKEIPDAGLAIL